MNKTKKSVPIAAGLLILLLAAAAALYIAMKPHTAAGAKHIDVTIVFDEANQKSFGIDTDAEYLREAVESVVEISGDEGPYGLFIKTVDGVTADDGLQQWWNITSSGESLPTGIDSTPIADGDHFELILTTGW